MMKKFIAILCAFLPLVSNAQNGSGINFYPAKNWSEVLQEAQRRNKPIFVDVYATWCGPCKLMDREVFSNAEIGQFVNSNFLPVKIQMDSTKNDDDYVRGWYKDAANMAFYINAFPTFLFFDSKGEYMGREQGFYKREDFLVILNKAIDPQGSYSAQMKLFKDDKLDELQLLRLAYWAKDNKDDSSAYKIASKYKAIYYDKQPLDSLLDEEADFFRNAFLKLFSFEDNIIRYMYKNSKMADKKLRRWPGYSLSTSDLIIKRDYVYNVIMPNNQFVTEVPNWKELEKTVSRKFNYSTAKRNILDVRIIWAYHTKNWKDAARLEFEKIDKYGMDTTGMGRVQLNNLVYDVVFKHVDDPTVLGKAKNLMKVVLNMDTTNHSRYDTYACILYKYGKSLEALGFEKKALSLAQKQKADHSVREYLDKITKMEKGQRLW